MKKVYEIFVVKSIQDSTGYTPRYAHEAPSHDALVCSDAHPYGTVNGSRKRQYEFDTEDEAVAYALESKLHDFYILPRYTKVYESVEDSGD